MDLGGIICNFIEDHHKGGALASLATEVGGLASSCEGNCMDFSEGYAFAGAP